jgi:transposase
MTTRLSNHIRGVLKTFGLLPGAMRGLPFDRKVEALLLDRSEVALIVRPMLVAWRQLREQIAVFDKAIRVLVRSNSACRLLMSVPGIGGLSALAYVSTVEDPGRFSRSRSVGAHLGLTPRQYQSGEAAPTKRSRVGWSVSAGARSGIVVIPPIAQDQSASFPAPLRSLRATPPSPCQV